MRDSKLAFGIFLIIFAEMSPTFASPFDLSHVSRCRYPLPLRRDSAFRPSRSTTEGLHSVYTDLQKSVSALPSVRPSMSFDLSLW